MTAPDRFVASAVDLGEVKARAEAAARAAATQSGAAQAVSTATLQTAQSLIVDQSMVSPVVVQVGSSRSSDSDAMREEFSRLAGLAGGAWVFVYVDADRDAQLAGMLGVKALPTVVAMWQGQAVTSFDGCQPPEVLAEFSAAVVSACGGPAAAQEPAKDPRFVDIDNCIAEGRFADAVAAADDIVAKEPANQEAKRYRTRASVASRAAALQGNPQDILRAAGSPGAPVAVVIDAADVMASRGDELYACELLVRRLEEGGIAPEEKNRIRVHLVDLLGLRDASSPQVADIRRRMASALF